MSDVRPSARNGRNRRETVETVETVGVDECWPAACGGLAAGTHIAHTPPLRSADVGIHFWRNRLIETTSVKGLKTGALRFLHRLLVYM